MYRNSYGEVDLDAITWNVHHFISEYPQYQYYFWVVKADSYGHTGNEVVKAIIDGWCNYLCVATLDEALEIRKEIKEIPILCLGIIPLQYLQICREQGITITISNGEYLNQVLKLGFKDLKVHLKVNSGMNRLGFKTSTELQDAFEKIQDSSLFLEGIFTHFYDAMSPIHNEEQYQKFLQITSWIDLKKIPIVHLAASDATMQLPKYEIMNGCRLWIVMYGLQDSEHFQGKSTFSLYSEVIQINELVAGETLWYGGIFKAEQNTKIAVVPIGYADGILRKNTWRTVFIHNKEYPIVGNICMDMLFVQGDDTIKVGDQVIIIKDIEHIKKIAHHLETIPYEVLCSISKRVPRIYKKRK